jgi:hypothetical protein
VIRTHSALAPSVRSQPSRLAREDLAGVRRWSLPHDVQQRQPGAGVRLASALLERGRGDGRERRELEDLVGLAAVLSAEQEHRAQPLVARGDRDLADEAVGRIARCAEQAVADVAARIEEPALVAARRDDREVDRGKHDGDGAVELACGQRSDATAPRTRQDGVDHPQVDVAQSVPGRWAALDPVVLESGRVHEGLRRMASR